jgi:hypothetical protein
MRLGIRFQVEDMHIPDSCSSTFYTKILDLRIPQLLCRFFWTDGIHEQAGTEFETCWD